MRANRRAFLLQVGTLAVERLVRRRPPVGGRPPAWSIHDCHVAGFRFHHGPALLGRMRTGEPVRLAREPQNPYDPYAVRVDYGGRKIGYLPRDQNRAVARLLDAGAPLRAGVVAVDRRADSWHAVRIGIELVGSRL